MKQKVDLSQEKNDKFFLLVDETPVMVRSVREYDNKVRIVNYPNKINARIWNRDFKTGRAPIYNRSRIEIKTVDPLNNEKGIMTFSSGRVVKTSETINGLEFEYIDIFDVA